METRKRKTAREVGLKLKDLREQERWSQTEMASRLGITASGYHKNEKGENTPGIDTLQRLRELFDLSMDWLLFDEGPKCLKGKNKKEKELEQALAELKGELAAEREKHLRELQEKELQEKLLQEKAGAIEMNAEVRELLEHMGRIPMLYHEIMLHFERFKVKNRELLGAFQVSDQS